MYWRDSTQDLRETDPRRILARRMKPGPEFRPGAWLRFYALCLFIAWPIRGYATSELSWPLFAAAMFLLAWSHFVRVERHA